MSSTPPPPSHRLPQGGVVQRDSVCRFRYDGRSYLGLSGDTLASALLANGVHLVGRSVKYHRPRGILSAGIEEPNALVQLGSGARTEPNVRATQLELYEGLTASSQNCWPSVRFDLGAINSTLLARLPPGFYYKTFMWPATPTWWLRYEHVIRKAAGLGKAANEADPDHYAHQFAHCDVLVIGAGPAGLAAARAAARCGARVILCDETAAPGGSVLGIDEQIDHTSAAAWLNEVLGELAANPEVKLLTRTTAFGYYDGNLVGLVERISDHLPQPSPHSPRQRMWKVRAGTVVLATGAHERPIAYANNDLPGTMLADSARTYVQRYAVRPGSRAVVFTNNDSAYASALALHRAGVSIAAIVDARPLAAHPGTLVQRAREAGLSILPASVIMEAHGAQRVRAVEVTPLGAPRGARQHIDCDLVCVSGGWNPAVHLFSQAQGRLRYDETLATFAPLNAHRSILATGAANACFELSEVLAQAHASGLAAAARVGLAPSGTLTAPHATPVSSGPPLALWAVEAPRKSAKRFVDFQNDLTVDDIALAAREGYDSVEHLKRYTALGMGTDQGKTSNVVGLALLAEQLGAPIPQIGTTRFRPPYSTVTLGTLPGHASGHQVEPTRHSALHDWHLAQGARMVNAGLWKRPHSYPRAGETEDQAAAREARNVRTCVGVVDVSTLGKIELQGRDVAELLNRLYINRWDTLAVGRCRYGVMLREDGMVLDDGTTSRLASQHYLMSTTTVNAVKVMQHIELLLQRDWPELQVHLSSVTEQWAAVALAGPRAREVLAQVVDIDVSNAAFPFLAVAECQLRTASASVPARLFRMSYSGENAYELHVAADQGQALWDALLAAGAAFGIMPYGTEAMGTLRIEKGHIVVGPEADGRTSADDLGLGTLVNAGKWCIGKPLLDRPGLSDPERWQLVGLTALDGAAMPRAAKLVADPGQALPNPMLGQVTSWCWSPNLQAWIALALLSRGRARHGDTLWAVSPLAGASVRVQVGPPCFIDPEGSRLRV